MNNIYQVTGINEKQLTLYLLCNSKQEVNKFSKYLWDDRQIGDIIEFNINDECCYYDEKTKELVHIPFIDLIKKKRLSLHKEYDKPIAIHHVYNN